jgi:hypothetical protein
MLQRSVVSGKVSGPDRSYLALLVAQRSGLAPPEAQKRVDETLSIPAVALFAVIGTEAP